MESLLRVENLNVGFKTSDGFVPAVTGLSFSMRAGESLAFVGESGCGKSVTALSILRLLKAPPAVIQADAVQFEDGNLTALSDSGMRSVRGNKIGMIFQEPMTSLNPLLPVGYQIAESVQLHLGLQKRAAHKYAVEMLNRVGIPEAEKRSREYPHQMSGGMRQRVMIAIALACKPDLLIADEPTTALDIIIQAQILQLIRDLKKEMNMAVLLITHNFGVVAEFAQRVMVMYAGQIVEDAPVGEIFNHPRHPYTIGLLTSIPPADEKKPVLNVIEGIVPNPLFYPKGCRFAPRCSKADGRCLKEQPELLETDGGHAVRCLHPVGDGEAGE